MAKFAVCTCVTFNHLHTALAFARSIRRTWPSSPPIYVVLIDHLELERPGFEELSGVEFIPARELGVPDFAWQLCKLGPDELCCLLKPFAVRRLLDIGYETVLYADSDFHFFSDAAPFVRSAEGADFLVTPHALSPLPAAEPWTRIRMGQLAQAGVLNAGIFVARETPGARAFLATWARLCAGPTAFLFGGDHEQHFFNWVYAYCENARVCRDPRVNVAYWNLHERPIRWGGLDGGDPEQWYLDGQPLISFHFSGFAWSRRALSSFDDRARPQLNANLYALCEYYARQLADAEQAYYASSPYEYGSVGGIELDRALRSELKQAEIRGTPQLADWARGAPAALRVLNTTLGDRGLVPRYLESVHERPDLTPMRDALFPRAWLRWVDRRLWREYERFGQLYEQVCPFVFHTAFIDDLVREIHALSPALEKTEIERWLKRDRLSLLQHLRAHGAPALIEETVDQASYRSAAYVPAVALRLIYAESAHLQQQFPDPFGRSAQSFRDWLRVGIARLFECPDSVLRLAEEFDADAAVARVLGKCLRIAPLAAALRTGCFGREQLFALVAGAQGGCGYDADDLVLADWWLERLGETARARLQVLAPPELGQSGFRDYLAAWCLRSGATGAASGGGAVSEAVSSLERFALQLQDAQPASAEQFSTAVRRALPRIAVSDAGVQQRLREALAPEPRGVNVFGYFKSPIGLGEATRGLCKALDAAGYPHRDLVIPNDSMDRELRLDDLFPDFAFSYPRNIVVSYPHIEYQLHEVRPRVFFQGRETIAYLAWEQRDFPAAWRERLAPYDGLCALSRFAADSIAQGVGRPCAVLPCVVEVGAPVPKAAARRQFGIPEHAFAVGFVFDAASSIERKNPWAVIDAVARAFGRSRDAVLVLKVGSGRRPDFVAQVAELERRAAAAGVELILIRDPLGRPDVEALLCSLDVYASLHRSEGFGYTLAEAMLLGVPALASAYSGNLDFMTEHNSHLVRCREAVVRAREGPFETGTVWAEPDLDHAAELLRDIRDHYGAALGRAQQATLELAAVVSPQAVARSAVAVLEGGRGPSAAPGGNARG